MSARTWSSWTVRGRGFFTSGEPMPWVGSLATSPLRRRYWKNERSAAVLRAMDAPE